MRELRFPNGTLNFKEDHCIPAELPHDAHLESVLDTPLYLLTIGGTLLTVQAALRFKTLQGILHICYIATLNVLTFIIPQGHKNVLSFIEYTDSELRHGPTYQSLKEP